VNWIPLGLLAVFFVFVGLGRMGLQRWRFGIWGWAQAPGRPLDGAQAALLGGAVLLGVEALGLAAWPDRLAAVRLPGPLGAPHPLWAAAVAAGAFALVLSAQLQMGRSWRIGIDPDAVTPLVTRGLYAHTRNPIYVGLVLGILGLTLALPTWLSLALLVFCAAAIRGIVRNEERYLRRVHGAAFQAYAARVPRFWPGGAR